MYVHGRVTRHAFYNGSCALALFAAVQKEMLVAIETMSMLAADWWKSLCREHGRAAAEP